MDYAAKTVKRTIAPFNVSSISKSSQPSKSPVNVTTGSSASRVSRSKTVKEDSPPKTILEDLPTKSNSRSSSESPPKTRTKVTTTTVDKPIIPVPPSKTSAIAVGKSKAAAKAVAKAAAKSKAKAGARKVVNKDFSDSEESEQSDKEEIKEEPKRSSSPRLVSSKPVVVTPRGSKTPKVYSKELVKEKYSQIEVPKTPRKSKTPRGRKTPKYLKDDELTEPEVLTLRYWQFKWADKIKKILEKNYIYIDTSDRGSGKTYLAMDTALFYGIEMFIVCNVTMIGIWEHLTRQYGVPVAAIISYQTLRSQFGYEPIHEYLDRHDILAVSKTKSLYFTPTKQYTALVEKGILLVIDEFQSIKNDSAQTKACTALIHEITKPNSNSRAALLSNTPIDDFKQAPNLLKVLGYIKSEKLTSYKFGTKTLAFEGLEELIQNCRELDDATTQSILDQVPINKDNVNNLCYLLYKHVIKPIISGAMSPPENIKGKFYVMNGFYNMSPEKYAELVDAIDRLTKALQSIGRVKRSQEQKKEKKRQKGEDSDLSEESEGLGGVIKALVAIENAKDEIFVRIAKQFLDDNNKVIISLNYNTTINYVVEHLSEYNPLLLTGDVPGRDRGEIIMAFNKDPNYRLLVMNTAVGGVGISLHDTVGDAPRVMLISPSYSLIKDAQATGRIYRDGTKSDAIAIAVYGKNTEEVPIREAMRRKTEVVKGLLEEEVLERIVLPGDYPDMEEND